MQILLSVLGEESGEGADFEQAAVVPGRIELVDLPAVDGGVVVPGLGLVVLALVLPPRLLRVAARFALAEFRLHGMAGESKDGGGSSGEVS